MLHASKSLEYNRGLLRKENPYEKEWGVKGAYTEEYRLTGYSGEPNADQMPEDESIRLSKTPIAEPMHTTGDPANAFALIMLLLAALVVLLGFTVFA